MPQDYIEECINKVEKNFLMFSQDEEFQNVKNFKGRNGFSVSLHKRFQTFLKDVLEFISLYKSGRKGMSYITLRDILTEFQRAGFLEILLPANINMTRFFQRLFDNSSDIAKSIGVDENALTFLLNQMVEHSNEIDTILKQSNNKANSLNHETQNLKK